MGVRLRMFSRLKRLHERVLFYMRRRWWRRHRIQNAGVIRKTALPFGPTWLADRLGAEKILVYRLDELLEDVDVLFNLFEQINPGVRPSRRDLKILQKTDINRKIRSDRTPESLWTKWTDEQREAFKRMCGPCMEYYRHAIPPRP